MKKIILIATVFLLSTSIALAQDFCKGDFTYDGDVDADDVTTFLEHFGRGQYDRPCPPDGITPVPKTGMTTSYRTGDDGDLERGVALVTPRFTDNGDGTITDNQTGLIWLKNANCFGFRRWDLALSDSNGLENGECGLTDGSSAGDWRLPNKRELISITHDGCYDPAVPNTTGTGCGSEGDPFNNVQTNYYWSSTTCAFYVHDAWVVRMSNGDVDYYSKNFDSFVWPVRGGR